MRPVAAIAELEELKSTISGPKLSDVDFESWKTRIRAVFRHAMTEPGDAIERFDKIKFHPGVYYGGMPDSMFDSAYRSGVDSAVGLIDGIIYELRLLGGDEPVDEYAYDPELWAHVKTQVRRRGVGEGGGAHRDLRRESRSHMGGPPEG